MGLIAADTVGKWETVQLRTKFLSAEDVANFADPLPSRAGTWENVPLTRSATNALAVAADLAESYRLTPLPPGALALGLVAEPGNGASRALLDGAEVAHAELLGLLQDETLDTRLEGLAETLRRTHAPRAAPEGEGADSREARERTAAR